MLRQFAVRLGVPLTEADKGIATDIRMDQDQNLVEEDKGLTTNTTADLDRYKEQKSIPDRVSESSRRLILMALFGFILGHILFALYSIAAYFHRR